MARWKERVMEKYSSCCRCGAEGSGHHVDHITPLSELVKSRGHKTIVDALADRELFRVRNGQRLCHGCHYGKTLKDAKEYGWDRTWVHKVFHQKKR